MKEQRLIDIEHLVADEENPRFDAVSTEEDALFSILEDQSVASGNKVLNLARNIAVNGLNASELLIVSPIEGTDNYRVREGNRRVTAIKLSLNSDSTPTQFSSLAPQFKELAEAMQKHRFIECYVCDNEEEIRRLLDLRHGGEKDGVGTVKWNAAQKARFSREGNQQSVRALSLIEHLREEYGQNELWATAAGIPATNLGRLISTPEVRQALGIDVNGNDVRYLGGHDDLLLDVFTTIKHGGVGPIYTKDARIKLVKEAVRRIEPAGQSQPSLFLDEDVADQKSGLVTKNADTNASDASANLSAEVFTHIQTDDEISESAHLIMEGTTEPTPDDNWASNRDSAGFVRRKPVSQSADKRMFVQTLRPRGIGSNDIYRGIDWIDIQYLKHPSELGHLLPILGISLRLLMESVAREYFLSTGEDRGDNSLRDFLKDVAKPAVKEKVDAVGRNNLTLASEWIDGKYNLEAIFGKWAHGTLAVDRAALVRQSEFVALIIDEIWS